MCCYFAYSTEYYRDFVGWLGKFRKGQENQSLQDLFHSNHQFRTSSSHLDKVFLIWKRYPKFLNWTPITVKLFKSWCWSPILLDNFLLMTFVSSKSQLSNFPLASFNEHPFKTKSMTIFWKAPETNVLHLLLLSNIIQRTNWKASSIGNCIAISIRFSF